MPRTAMPLTLLLLSISIASWGAGTLYGEVVDAKIGTTPIPEVVVAIIDPNSGHDAPGLWAVTNERGLYEIADIPPGNWKVHFNAVNGSEHYRDELYNDIPCDNGMCEMDINGSVIAIAEGRNTLDVALSTYKLSSKEMSAVMLLIQRQEPEEEPPSDSMELLYSHVPDTGSATNIPAFKLYFNHSIDVDASQIQASLTDNYGHSWPLTSSIQERQLNLSVSQALRYNTTYSLMIEGIVNEVDNVAPPFSYSFKTKARDSGFFLGGVVVDGLIDGLFGGPSSANYMIDTLAANGVKNFRVGQTTTESEFLETTDPDTWINSGWNEAIWSSRALNAHAFELLGDRHGGHNSVFLFFSSTSTHVYKYATLNGWEDLTDAEVLVQIELHAKESAQFYADKGIAVDQFEVGNETDWGVAGFYAGDGGRVKNAPDDWWSNRQWQRENLWVHHVNVINAAAKGVRSVFPDSKIVVHNVGYFQPEGYTVDFYQHLIDEGVDFDVIGLSYPYLSSPADLEELYDTKPFFRGQTFHNILRELSSLEKEIQLSEFSYHHNPMGANIEPAEEYPTTPQGQADFITDMINEWASYPMVSGAYYFYPDYYWGRCNCFADSIGLWGQPSSPQPAMEAFRQLDLKYNQ